MSSGRRQYPFHLIEPKWRRIWEQQQTFRAWNPEDFLPEKHPFAVRHGLHGKLAAHQLPPKYYILDMFPYPSGAGLHVGHPEGYTATDILARYKRAQGFNVLHPMGWDAFGLPAEQYAIRTGQHPRKTTEQNIATFKHQVQSLGFSYDWTREIDTTDPEYFRWTQWIFLQLYNAWFNPKTNRAEPIETLPYPPELERGSDAELEARRRAYRDSKRLAYVTEAPVWWCESLGTVLANEEVVDGKSEVGDFSVVRKPMRQWMLRITAYAGRLLDDLDTIDWSSSLKEMQRNWIGRSEGAEVDFAIAESSMRKVEGRARIRVFTTRPDTLFGATYMVLAPEHTLVAQITTPDQQAAVQAYQTDVAKKSDLERTELAKEKTGVFTGAYAVNPATGENIPVWIADYVLASYGTGAIMGVPGHDERDWEFAKKFDLTIRDVVIPGSAGVPPAPSGVAPEGTATSTAVRPTPHSGSVPAAEKCFTGDGVGVNSANAEISLNGLPTPEAKSRMTAWLEAKGLGRKMVNFKLRDWLFSRQRYWGEPFPIVWKRDARGHLFHEALPESALPVLPPPLDDYKPTAEGQPPLARAKDWVALADGSQRETNTMPQWAGSCWYYLRYLDPENREHMVGRSAERYWMGRRSLRVPASVEELDAAIRVLIELTYREPGAPRQRVAFGQVTPELAVRIRVATGLELNGYLHVLDNYAVRHARKEHGDPGSERRRGQEPVVDDTFLRVPWVVLAPDEIEYAGTSASGLEMLRFRKRIDGVVVVVEEVRASANLLAVVTVYQGKAAAGDAAIGASLGTSDDDRRKEVLHRHLPHVKLPTHGVDLYVGGTEHAVLHLLYARFWHKVLFDLGCVSTREPFHKLVNQGLILGEDGQKMSKSRGNVINPDDILAQYGADAFRLYEMFMGPLEMVKPWSTKGVEGVYRFLGRVWRLFVDEPSETGFEQAETIGETPERGALLDIVRLSPAIRDAPPTPAQLKILHAGIKKVTEDLDGFRFNTAISALMVFVNEAMTWGVKPCSVMRDFLVLLQPFAPHLAEELWAKLHSAFRTPHSALAYAPWPQFEPVLLVEDTVEIPVQVNGKLRAVIIVPTAATAAEIQAAALASEKVKMFLAGSTIKKIIVVPKKVVNIAVG